MCFDIAGIAVLVAAAFFGYMLALLQQRVRAMFSSKDVSFPRICVFNLQLLNVLVTGEMSHRYLCHNVSNYNLPIMLYATPYRIFFFKKKGHTQCKKLPLLCSPREVMIGSFTSNLLEKFSGPEPATCHRNLIYNFTTNCHRMVVRIHNFHFGFMSS